MPLTEDEKLQENKTINKPMNVSVWKYYLQFYQGSRFYFILNIFLSVLLSITVVPIALMVRLIFDEAIPKKNVSQLIGFSIIIFILYILNGGLTLWSRYISLNITKVAIKRMRDEIVKKIYVFPRSYYTAKDHMVFHTRIVQDTLRVDVMSNALVAQFFPSILIIVGLIGFLVYLNIFLFLFLISIAPLLIIFNKYMGRNIRKKVNSFHRYFEVFSKRISTILEILDLTRIRSCENDEIQEQKKIHDELRKRSTAQAWFNAAYQIIQKTTIVSMGIIILTAGGYFIILDKMTLGALFAFFAATGLLRNYLLIVAGVIPNIIEGNESLKGLYKIMTARLPLPYTGKKKIKFKGQVSFKNVDFRYGSHQVLNQISFTLVPHKVTCILGPNGSGKSTIANLILGFYRPEGGQVFAGNHPYEKLDLIYLRRFFGVVQQNPIILPGSIYENITYGLPKVKKEKLLKVLKLTLCEEFINKLPEGLNTQIKEKGQILSGGEIQRIAIARALLGDYKLLILDEPTNHLEQAVMKKILTNIRNLKASPTVIMFTLAKPATNLADSILILKNGRIINKKGTKKF